MSKKVQSTLMLFVIGVGFGIFSINSLFNAQTGDDRVQALLYLVPAVAAFGALILLPTRHAE